METNKFWRMTILIAILSSALVASVGAQTSSNDALSLVNLRVTPQPVVAGSNVTILFQLYNSYSSSLQNVNLELTASNPIINVSPSGQQLISAIGQGIYGSGFSGAGNFQYTLHIPSTLRAGQYTLDLVANYQASPGGTQSLPSVSTMPISMYIYGVPSIQLTANLQSNLVPGQSTSVPVSVVNAGTDVANNVTVTLHNSQYFKIFGAQRFSLGAISPDASTSFSASVQPSLSIQNGTYMINATINYTAQSGKFVSKNTTIAISTFINSPNIVASISSATPTNLYAGGNQTLQVQIQNTGLGTAKNITVKFLSGAGINVGSISQFYISSLSPKNSTTETVYISANRSFNTSAGLNLPVSFRYYSSNYGGNFVTVQNIPINIQGSSIFNVTSVTGTLKPGDAYKPITFRVKNIGNIQAQQITFSLQTTFPITPVNPNVYVVSLAPGQTQNVTFYVGVDPSGNLGSYPVTLFEQWRQPNGAVSQQFSGSNGYYANVGTTSGGSTTTNLILPIVIVIVIVGVAAYMIRKRGGLKSFTQKKKS